MKDFVTGETVVDTDDERYRQKLARMLVEEKGYDKKDIEPRCKIETLFGGNFVVTLVDLVISVSGKRLMVIRYGPGSLVTRERPALAAARVLEAEYVIPFAVVTNGEDAEFLDSHTGEVIVCGLDGIPEKQKALELFASASFAPLARKSQAEMERRILNAYDAQVCCAGGPCALPEAPEG